MVKIKVCGITRREDIITLADLRIDYAGFIFYKDSPRYVTPDVVGNISGSIPDKIKKVGVFVNAPKEDILETYDKSGLDMVQLHGDESPEFCDGLNIPYWKAFRVSPEFDMDEILRYGSDTCLIDTYSSTGYGGTGTPIDQKIVKDIITGLSHHDIRVMVAGGIGVRNIDDIIRMDPYGVDINSTVETSPGVKSKNKIYEVMKHVQGRSIFR